MPRILSTAVALAVTVGIAAGAASPANAAPRSSAPAAVPTIAVSTSHVLQSDPVTVYGRAVRPSWLYQRVNSGDWHRVKTVHGSYRVTTHPTAGAVTWYRTANSRSVAVASTACAPLSSPGAVSAWFNVRYASRSVVASNWARAICSAAPNSTITLASMFVWGGGSADALVADLRAVAAYRHVTVHVLVQRSQFTSASADDPLAWAHFTRAFAFADVHACAAGCTVKVGGSSMHYKYMTISRTVFGGSAVIESSLNWSPQQFDRQNGSAVYFYNNPGLYQAYYAAFFRATRETPATSALKSAGWTSSGAGVAYAFDPSTSMGDPISNELATMHCAPGDYIDVVNANVTRGRLVRQLNRLHAAGCAVRLITEQLFRAPAAQFGMAHHMITHDKFVLIHAHNARGAISEVITGSEDFRPASMLVAEEQLVRVQLSTVVAGYAHWFSQEWQLTWV